MKRKITFLIAVIAALMLITQPMKAVGQVVSGTLYTTTSSSFPTGWSSDGSFNGYKLLNYTSCYIQTSTFVQNGFTSIVVYARKYGGPTDSEKVITVSWYDASTNTETVLGTVSPTSTSLANYTISSPSNPTGNTEGYIKIQCKNANSQGKGSGVGAVTINYTAGATKLTAPTLTATAGVKRVNLSWATISNASSYTLEYADNNSFTSSQTISGISNSATSYTVTTLNDVALSAGTTYYFKLKAVGNGTTYTDSDFSTTQNATPVANITLTAPTLTAATGSHQGEVDLSWNAIEHASSYTISYSTDQSSWSDIENISNELTSYTKSGLTNGTTYYFKAQAVGDGVDYITSAFSTTVNATPTVPQLAKPAFTAITPGNGKVTPTWTNDANASSYTIEYSTKSDFSSAVEEIAPATSGVDITSLTNETKYYFRLKAVGDGENYTTSIWSDTENATPSNKQSITITEDDIANFDDAYNWYDWTVGGISGRVYAFQNSGIQFNSGKTAYCIYNTDAIPGTIKSIKMIKASGTDRSWTLKVGTSSITATTGGTIMGSVQTVGTSGATWDVTDDYDYFFLFVSGGATVIESIEITYIPKYTVTYNANGGTGDAPAVASYYEAASVTAAAANTFTVPSANHTFNTWNTKADGSGTSYPAGEAFSMPGANITLYAQWNRNIPVDGNNEITEDVTVAAGETVTISSITKIPNGRTLTINGTLVSATAANLVVEDGGQLIVHNAGVNATIEKALSSARTGTNWYTIASPVKDISIGTPSQSGDVIHLKDAEYDLYRYNETSTTWENHKDTGHHSDFNKLLSGHGYLYRRDGATTLAYTGVVNGSASETVSLTVDGSGELKGLNLIGNPYSHNIYKGEGGAIDNDQLSAGYYRLKNDATWGSKLDYDEPILSGEGILVQAISEIDLEIVNTDNVATNESKSGKDNIMFSITNVNYEDVTYALFHEGYGLNKINHRNPEAPMIYIAKDDAHYAIATMSDDTKIINLCFKAMTIGQYTLNYKADGDFSYLHVIDRMTGEDVDMLMEGEYGFIASPSDAESRFIVRLEYSNGYENSEDSIFAYQSGSDIIVNGEGELQIFDVMGRRVSTQYVSGVETINLRSHGVYIFKLNEKTQKIVVK